MSYPNKKSGGWKDKKPAFGGGKKFGGGYEERPTMHMATCASCGNSCEVPFKPNGRKPVFCRDCFRKEEGAGESFGGAKSFEKSSYQSTPHGGNEEVVRQLKTLNGKMDQILNVMKQLLEDAEDTDGDEDDEDEETDA